MACRGGDTGCWDHRGGPTKFLGEPLNEIDALEKMAGEVPDGPPPGCRPRPNKKKSCLIKKGRDFEEATQPLRGKIG